jgi:hypothetical protein
VRPFLVSTIGQYLADTPESYDENFILLAGRRYFSRSARKLSGILYAKKHGIEQARLVYEVCSEYRTLVFPRDYNRAQELIEKLIEIIPITLETQSGCAHRKPMRNGKPETEKQQGQLQGEILADNETDLFSPADGEGQGEGDDNNEVAPENSGFNEHDDFTEHVREEVERAKSDKALQKKVRDTSRAITKDGSTRSILGKSPRSYFEPSFKDTVTARLFGQELERLRIDSDPAWEREKPSGKLNVRRAMQADINDLNKLFDRWENGSDEYDIEACILIDRSGSMGYDIGSACRSAWIIKRALEKIEGKVSVMAFNDVSKTLYTADEKASASQVAIVESRGGTEPYYGVLEAERILLQSQRKTKLMFLLTDGQFGNESNQIIERLNKADVDTTLVFLGNDYWRKELAESPQLALEWSHGANNFEMIGSPTDLVKVAKTVVRNHLKKVRR